MNIDGIGLVFAGGRGTDCLENALAQGWSPPSIPDPPGPQSVGSPLYEVPAEALADKELSRKTRRADRFGKMAVVAAADAMTDSGVGIPDPTRLGIIVATALGPHTTTFRFLDDMIDYGDNSVSPTTFSHSVHNAAASYVASVLDIRGPAITVTHFHFAFHEAVRLAEAWLSEARCDHVLVGAIDECGTVMNYIAGRKLRMAVDGKICPFQLGPMPATVPGEGSAFFLMSGQPTGKQYCAVAAGPPDHAAAVDGLVIINSDGMSPDESTYLRALGPGSVVGAYAPLFGGLMTGSAFDCAVGALSIRNGTTYPPPVTDNPHGLRLCGNEPAPETITCVKCDCGGRQATLTLSDF